MIEDLNHVWTDEESNPLLDTRGFSDAQIKLPEACGPEEISPAPCVCTEIDAAKSSTVDAGSLKIFKLEPPVAGFPPPTPP